VHRIAAHCNVDEAVQKFYITITRHSVYAVYSGAGRELHNFIYMCRPASQATHTASARMVASCACQIPCGTAVHVTS
jgi:hypothetical protein